LGGVSCDKEILESVAIAKAAIHTAELLLTGSFQAIFKYFSEVERALLVGWLPDVEAESRALFDAPLREQLRMIV